MNLLALDTATLVASVAVRCGGRVAAVRDARVTTHSESLLVLIDEALREAGLAPDALDAVACGAGPGSFTGLRIGMATAKGLCFALGKPLVTVSSLAALALEAAPGPRVLALLDAHKKEVYAGIFQLHGPAPVPVKAEAVLPPGRLVEWVPPGDPPLLVVGDGALAYPSEAAEVGQLLEGARSTPAASTIAALAEQRLAGGGDAIDELVTSVPKYIRPSEAELKFPDGLPGRR